MDTIDKSTWPSGPWQDEPDWEAWTDEDTGMACAVARSKFHGHLNGYVGVPEGHHLNGCEGMFNDAFKELNVHGGISFGGKFKPEYDAGGLWWIGFDCGHLGDLCPAPGRYDDTSHGIYWSMPSVKRMTADLARQVHAMEKNS